LGTVLTRVDGNPTAFNVHHAVILVLEFPDRFIKRIATIPLRLDITILLSNDGLIEV
jgi:hypothetical protein